MNMLICWLKVNVENIEDASNTYLPPLVFMLLSSMYVLKVLCYVVLKLEVNKSVAGHDFFPGNISSCKTDF